jgi:hypothetical protein
LGFLEVFVELFFSTLCSHSLCEHFQWSFWPKGFYKCKGMADTSDRGFRKELDYFFQRPEKPLQQGPLTCFAFFWWIYHIHERLGGSPKILQFLCPPPFLLTQRLDLLKAVGELLFSVINHLLQPLDIICTVIQHVLHISKQLFFTH